MCRCWPKPVVVAPGWKSVDAGWIVSVLLRCSDTHHALRRPVCLLHQSPVIPATISLDLDRSVRILALPKRVVSDQTVATPLVRMSGHLVLAGPNLLPLPLSLRRQFPLSHAACAITAPRVRPGFGIRRLRDQLRLPWPIPESLP